MKFTTPSGRYVSYFERVRRSLLWSERWQFQLNTVRVQATMVPSHSIERSNLRPRKNVVTSFIERRGPGSRLEYLLVKRSDKVSTYKEYWGGVSGGVEEDDEDLRARAGTEIEEEVGLVAGEDVYLIRQGRPVPVHDGSKEFLVFPFLYRMTDSCSKSFRLNWENTEARFFTIEEIRDAEPKVPLLVRTLERVLIRNGTQDGCIADILQDRQHGAAELCLKALVHIQKVALDLKDDDFDSTSEYISAVQDFGYQVASCRPSMSTIANVVACTLSDWVSKRESYQCIQDAYDTLVKGLQEQDVYIAQANKRAVENGVAHLKTISSSKERIKIVTISLSSSIKGVIDILSRSEQVELVISESRPLFEGVSLAQGFVDNPNVHITIITEAQLHTCLLDNDTDAIVCGADSFTRDGIVNKVGTMTMALLSQYHHVPMVVISDISKAHISLEYRLSDGTLRKPRFMFEEKGVEEVELAWASLSRSTFTVRNTYFEEVPYSLIDYIISSSGLLGVKDIEEYMSQLDQRFTTAFLDS